MIFLEYLINYMLIRPHSACRLLKKKVADGDVTRVQSEFFIGKGQTAKDVIKCCLKGRHYIKDGAIYELRVNLFF